MGFKYHRILPVYKAVLLYVMIGKVKEKSKENRSIKGGIHMEIRARP